MAANDMGPFKNLTEEGLRSFFHCMQTMSLTFSYKSVHLQYDHPLDYILVVTLLYDNSVQGGRIGLTMSWTKTSTYDLPYAKLLQLYKVCIWLVPIPTLSHF